MLFLFDPAFDDAFAVSLSPLLLSEMASSASSGYSKESSLEDEPPSRLGWTSSSGMLKLKRCRCLTNLFITLL